MSTQLVQRLRRSGIGLTATLCCIGASARAQAAPQFGSIEGIIGDSASGPVEGAFVEVGRREARTDAQGKFRLDSIPSGTASLAVLKAGYGLYTRHKTPVSAGATIRLEIWIRPYDYVSPEETVNRADSGASGAYSAADAERAAAYTGFSLALFRAIVAKTPTRNVFISPASAALVLSMTASGASGSTRNAMARTLGADSLTQNQLDDENAALLATMGQQSGVRLTIANSIWADEGRPFLPAFLAGVEQHYHAEVRSLVLHGTAAQARINGWASKSTNGRIPIILADTLPNSTSMVLMNAVYFKGKWRDKFDSTETKAHPFTLPGGRKESRQLMTRRDQIMYVSDSGVQVARLPYRGGRIAMYVILPDSGVPIARVVANLSPAKWLRWMRSDSSRDLHLELPRFRLEYGASLAPELASLGMGVAFDCDKASFARMLPAEYLRKHPTCIDDVFQRAFVEVNEQGTEAAAVTAVGMLSPTGMLTPRPPIEFIVDRPFAVAIRDERSGLLLFLGQITDPRSQ